MDLGWRAAFNRWHHLRFRRLRRPKLRAIVILSRRRIRQATLPLRQHHVQLLLRVRSISNLFFLFWHNLQLVDRASFVLLFLRRKLRWIRMLLEVLLLLDW